MRHILEGLQRWVLREEWQGGLAAKVELHLGVLEDYDLDEEEVLELLGEDGYHMVLDMAFEDFLAHEDGDGRNVVDDYLKRRGWKEGASAKAYMKALRHSRLSLYEVSEIVPGESFLARDLIRGGEPIRVAERLGTQKSLVLWDRLATRIVTVQGKTQMTGGILRFSHEGSEELRLALDEFAQAVRNGKEILEEETGLSLPEALTSKLWSIDGLLTVSAALFSEVWLRDVLDRRMSRRMVTFEGDDIDPVTLSFPLVQGVTQKQVKARLSEVAVLRPAGAKFWNWVEPKPKRSTALAKGTMVVGTERDGASVMGDIEIQGRALFLTTVSRPRADRGRDMLTTALKDLVGTPTEVEREKPSKPRASGLSTEEKRAIVQDYLDQHYAKLLEEPVPALGGVSPRVAVRSAEGREQAVAWLKLMENASASNRGSGLEGYDMTWMWKELGLHDRRV